MKEPAGQKVTRKGTQATRFSLQLCFANQHTPFLEACKPEACGCRNEVFDGADHALHNRLMLGSIAKMDTSQNQTRQENGLSRTMYRITKAAAPIYGWDCPILPSDYPGFDCDSRKPDRLSCSWEAEFRSSKGTAEIGYFEQQRDSTPFRMQSGHLPLISR